MVEGAAAWGEWHVCGTTDWPVKEKVDVKVLPPHSSLHAPEQLAWVHMTDTRCLLPCQGLLVITSDREGAV